MRRILHCDLNNFFASVEQVNNPELKNVPMAVCGDPNRRHGIILAKNYEAKKYGIYTPETVVSAKKKCPHLVLVEPHYEEYLKYSNLVNEIYLKYSDYVEPFSIDESYIDITNSIKLFGSAEEIAFKIKEEIKEKYGLTISVGISFNKTFAKMGSDMKKPDAITTIYEDEYKEKLYNLDVSNLIFCGKSMQEKLKKMRIEKIGDLAYADKNLIISKFGKVGLRLYEVANGIDNEEVKKYDDEVLPKSISKAMTLPEDSDDINKIISICKVLCENSVKRLRKYKMKCSTVGISIKNSMFVTTSNQVTISSSDSYELIFIEIEKILQKMIVKNVFVRTVTVFLSNLSLNEAEEQINLFEINVEKTKKEKALEIVDSFKDKKIDIGFASTIKK